MPHLRSFNHCRKTFSEASFPKKSVRPTGGMSQSEAPDEQSSRVEGGGYH